jgi:hypothetical protein
VHLPEGGEAELAHQGQIYNSLITTGLAMI